MNAAKVILIVVLAIVLVVGGGYAWRYFSAPMRGAVDAQEQIESAASRIPRYQHFFDLCSSIQANEDAIDAQQARLEHIDPESGEASRVRTIIAGLQSQRAKNIRSYNADAANEYTMGRFRSSKLPYRLDTDTENTRCIVNVE